jgi:hypothetical protein
MGLFISNLKLFYETTLQLQTSFVTTHRTSLFNYRIVVDTTCFQFWIVKIQMPWSPVDSNLGLFEVAFGSKDQDMAESLLLLLHFLHGWALSLKLLADCSY